MRTLCIVPCGKRRISDKKPDNGPTPAQDVYIGPFAKKCREYALKFHPSSWCILSAKYGFLFPEESVPSNYNVSFNQGRSSPISVNQLAAQVTEKGLDKYEQIVVLGGKNYGTMIREVFAETDILLPLSDCKGMGYMMKKLHKAIKEHTPMQCGCRP